MATDFFDRQADVRRRTGRLVIYFVIAVILIIASIYAAFTGILIASHKPNQVPPPQPFDPIRLAIISTITGVVILLGSLFKIIALREGGGAVARSLGGRLVDGSTRDLAERKLLNVVEEMALASGTPVPPVYVMDDEPGINAFAAGHDPTDAAIGVTRGTIDHLNRDQLQGVIAHEFSHILNGDMRLNIKLMGTLHGILLLALVGQILMRMAGNSGSRSSRSNDKNNGAMLFFLGGLALFIIGYLGVFFGRLIKSAVSRQREFLADASAVQFTRNPDGIAGALKKIGGLSIGARIENPAAEEASHMFFGAALPSLSSLLATHPPLEERIKRIDPQFDGVFPTVREDEHVDLDAPEEPRKPKRKPAIGGLGAVLPGVNIPGNLGGAILLPAASAVSMVGAPRSEHVAYAANLKARLPDELLAAAHEPYGASALVYALLLDDDVDVRSKQLATLAQDAAPGLAGEAERLASMVATVGPEGRIPLVDLAMPALRNLSADQYAQFRRNIDPLVRADGRVSLFEFALQRMLFRHLDHQFQHLSPTHVRYPRIGPVMNRVSLLIGSLAWIGQQGAEAVGAAYEAGVRALGVVAPALPVREQCSLATVDAALNDLAKASPAVKRQVLDGCAATISADGKVTVAEGELLRAIADSLDCPMPPLLTA